ncbi:hypothetical protein BGZ65_012090 [Modicella reniformis]|uniref:Arm-like repeat domain-containing protein n=1 Tax=Modicella reniformis TaxID=1440133 RepID=A0A9P6J5H4_9FUNG|nr:hypothetical protein BGZ65_012090 [Modicella reniformis]
MFSRNLVPMPKKALSLQQALELTEIYLENASKTNDHDITLVLCHDAEVALFQAKSATRNASTDLQVTGEVALREGIAAAYITIGQLLEIQEYRSEAKAMFKKAEKWGGHVQQSGRVARRSHLNSVAQPTEETSFPAKNTSVPEQSPLHSLNLPKQGRDIAMIPHNIFATNISPPSVIVFKPPKADKHLSSTPQLACCLGLLQGSHSLGEIVDSVARNWLQVTRDNSDEQERLKNLATEVIRAFKRDEFKDAKAVAEVVTLAPVLEKDDFRYLLMQFYQGIDQSGLLNVHQLEGLAQLIQGADPGYLEADDLVKVLELISQRLKETHRQSQQYMYRLMYALLHVLDAMADTKIKDLDRAKLHEPLSSYLNGLKSSSDPFLVYQAAYAYQALQWVPDNETLWQTTLRRTGKVIQVVSGLLKAVKGLDLNGFMEGLKDIQQGLAGASDVVKLIKDTYDDVNTLAKSGQDFLDCLKESFSFDRKRSWYPALRGADTLIRDGELEKFRKLVCEAPCRRDPAFQIGVCQRLGEIAANPMWDVEIRRSAVVFLGEIFQNDAEWGRQTNIKQWILNILKQLASPSEGALQFAKAMLQDLETNVDGKKQALVQACRDNELISHPLNVSFPALESPSLLDRVQNRPDVEGNLRLLRKRRLDEQGHTVYIPPQAKASLQVSDSVRFPLMEMVQEFLDGDQKVFLLLGDSGAGKSTFNLQLECDLWKAYEKNIGIIPLHINLPAIDKPEHDMIAKQLRNAEFTETQIRELKFNRRFILICDGYDESQQSHNLYMSNRLNQPGEWNAKIVISCRSEYLGVDYRDRFQPVDRNRQSEPVLFQEAVITPFSVNQTEEYIDQYVSLHQPLWDANEYKTTLDLIPSLKELVKNPFLMSLSLEVLPRMVDPRQHLSATRITRVALYDQFDEGSWKAAFFSRDEEKQLLREACPLTRSGNQHRFIHRSLLEYGLALAVFDPLEWKEQILPELTMVRRGSMSSDMSFRILDPTEDLILKTEIGPDLNSPLAWRNFVNEPSVLQFLVERVQQESVFKKQLLDYIEYSKTDKKWRIAAANAITILVRAGVQFNCVDLSGIQIPGADLSYGVFDSTQFQEADLRHVNLRGVWLHKANLNKAQMTGVQFGELPYLREVHKVCWCGYSPDGKFFAVGLDKGTISVYSTSNWERLWTSKGHDNWVLNVIHSPKGDLIASRSWDKTVQLWDFETGTCRHNLSGHRSTVNWVACSPQGDQIASAGDDNTVRLWNVETGECRHVFTDHTHAVQMVVYSPKNKQVASCSDDTTVRLWDVETGVCCHTLEGHHGYVRSVVYSPQGDRVASASHDKTVRLWDVETGACCFTFTGHTKEVCDLKCSPKGDQIASASNDGTVRLWNVQTGDCLHVLRVSTGNVWKIAYSPQGDQIASASDDCTVRLWGVETGLCNQTLIGHTEKIQSVVYSPKGDHVASYSEDGTVRLWDVNIGTSRHLASGHSKRVWRVMFSPTRDEFASSSWDGTIRLWDVKTGVCQLVLGGYGSWIRNVAYSPQGNQIAYGSDHYTVRLWDVETGACLRTLTGHSNHVTSVVYSPQGKQVASASSDNTVRLWDVETGDCRHVFTDHTDLVLMVVYSPKGKQVASCSLDTTVRLWDVETGVCCHTLKGHHGYVRSVVYSPQGDRVASASHDKTVRLWDVRTGACLYILSGHNDIVLSVQYSPKGDQVVSASNDGTVRLWDVGTGDCQHTLIGHSDAILETAYSPQGDQVASVSSDRSVRLWDVASGQCRAVIQDIRSPIKTLDLGSTSNAKYLVIGCEDGSVQTWQVIDGEDQCHVRLCWRTTEGELIVRDASIQDVQGLNQLNKRLLTERGAVGEPAHRLWEPSKKLVDMGSLMSKLKQLSNTLAAYSSSTVDTSVEQLKYIAEELED